MVFGYASNTRPKRGMKTAPPKNGKRFTIPVEVPAISMGKSSLIVVNATITEDDAHIEKMKKKTYSVKHPRPDG